MAVKRIKKVCAKCGSEDIRFDSHTVWNFKTQQFEVLTIYDKGHACEGECGGFCKVVDIEVEDNCGIN